MQACLQIKLPPALLEEIFEALAEEVHNHDVEHGTVRGLLVANEVEEGNVGLTAQLVDQLTLPEEHDVALHLHCFFLRAKKRRGQKSEKGMRWSGNLCHHHVQGDFLPVMSDFKCEGAIAAWLILSDQREKVCQHRSYMQEKAEMEGLSNGEGLESLRLRENCSVVLKSHS